MVFKGDVKDVTLTMKAIAFFNKTVSEFEEKLQGFTRKQRIKYCELLVTSYLQIVSITKDVAEKRI